MGLMDKVGNFFSGGGDTEKAIKRAGRYAERTLTPMMDDYKPFEANLQQGIDYMADAATVEGMDRQIGDVEASDVFRRMLTGANRNAVQALADQNQTRSGYGSGVTSQAYLDLLMGMGDQMYQRQQPLVQMGQYGLEGRHGLQKDIINAKTGAMVGSAQAKGANRAAGLKGLLDIAGTTADAYTAFTG